MVPKIGQKVTYADENSKEFTAKIVSILKDEHQYRVNIEYRRDNGSTGKVNSVPLSDSANTKDSHAKIKCFTKQTPKPDTKKPDTKKSG